MPNGNDWYRILQSVTLLTSQVAHLLVMQADTCQDLSFLVFYALAGLCNANVPVPKEWNCADDQFLDTGLITQDQHLIFIRWFNRADNMNVKGSKQTFR